MLIAQFLRRQQRATSGAVLFAQHKLLCSDQRTPKSVSPSAQLDAVCADKQYGLRAFAAARQRFEPAREEFEDYASTLGRRLHEVAKLALAKFAREKCGGLELSKDDEALSCFGEALLDYKDEHSWKMLTFSATMLMHDYCDSLLVHQEVQDYKRHVKRVRELIEHLEQRPAPDEAELASILAKFEKEKEELKKRRGY